MRRRGERAHRSRPRRRARFSQATLRVARRPHERRVPWPTASREHRPPTGSGIVATSIASTASRAGRQRTARPRRDGLADEAHGVDRQRVLRRRGGGRPVGALEVGRLGSGLTPAATRSATGDDRARRRASRPRRSRRSSAMRRVRMRRAQERAWSWPSTATSSAKRPWPRRSASSSTRRTDLPLPKRANSEGAGTRVSPAKARGRASISADASAAASTAARDATRAACGSCGSPSRGRDSSRARAASRRSPSNDKARTRARCRRAARRAPT